MLDTHLLLWAAAASDRLPADARALLDDPFNEPIFSSASFWEIAIKSGLGRADFQVNARLLRRGLLDNGYTELPVTSQHAVAIDGLPQIHKDPFDRLLVAQSMVEGITASHHRPSSSPAIRRPSGRYSPEAHEEKLMVDRLSWLPPRHLAVGIGSSAESLIWATH